MRRVPGFSLLFVLLTAVCATAGAAHAQERYPVDYNFFAGIPAELSHPGGSLPGTNDWSCRPGSEHPNPVVLVHGTGGGAQTNWGVYAPLLANEGYCVYSSTFGAYNLPWPASAIGGMLPIEQSSAQLAAFVDRVRTATGAGKVDLIGHSQGNFIGNYYVKRLGGAAKVDKMVGLAPPWLGSNAGGMADLNEFGTRLGLGPLFDAVAGSPCMACRQVLQGSEFVRTLNADGVYHPDVAYTNIATELDELVVPYTSGLVTGPRVTNIVVQDGCSTDYSGHTGIAGSKRAATYVLNALDPAHQRPVPCGVADPYTG
ncbi:esterase/lipase family protein [Nocardia gamkensis]|uniref:Alpha/beta fold hydrolase n=1 Tax=Nocardia gamkensis TaxID=352869 RepID=A0A7X6L771_9NOCA|nr:alpha/beta fold hydrolase [Nocardia gamkensis]NQE66153.1 Extracellular esterase EstB [Nocardia gamkensis]